MARYLASAEPDGEIRLVADSPTKEIRSNPDLSKLPIFTYFKNDSPPYTTALKFDQHFDAGVIERGLENRGFDNEVVRIKGSNSDRLYSTKGVIDRILEMNKI